MAERSNLRWARNRTKSCLSNCGFQSQPNIPKVIRSKRMTFVFYMKDEIFEMSLRTHIPESLRAGQHPVAQQISTSNQLMVLKIPFRIVAAHIKFGQCWRAVS
jgi:hypothetical protein